MVSAIWSGRHRLCHTAIPPSGTADADPQSSGYSQPVLRFIEPGLAFLTSAKWLTAHSVAITIEVEPVSGIATIHRRSTCSSRLTAIPERTTV